MFLVLVLVLVLGIGGPLKGLLWGLMGALLPLVSERRILEFRVKEYP